MVAAITHLVTVAMRNVAHLAQCEIDAFSVDLCQKREIVRTVGYCIALRVTGRHRSPAHVSGLTFIVQGHGVDLRSFLPPVLEQS